MGPIDPILGTYRPIKAGNCGQGPSPVAAPLSEATIEVSGVVGADAAPSHGAQKKRGLSGPKYGKTKYRFVGFSSFFKVIIGV